MWLVKDEAAPVYGGWAETEHPREIKSSGQNTGAVAIVLDQLHCCLLVCSPLLSLLLYRCLLAQQLHRSLGERLRGTHVLAVALACTRAVSYMPPVASLLLQDLWSFQSRLCTCAGAFMYALPTTAQFQTQTQHACKH